MDNIYFVWSIYFITILWLARVFQGKEKLSLSVPVMMLSVLFVYLLATLRFSWQYGHSYPILWLWAGYLCLFVVSFHVTREVALRKMLLFVFLAAMGAQALFSILHFEFLLPYLRTIVQNPLVLRRYFNTDVITPDLARRFMVNRAFGTMLFPNTLAGFLILGIPFSVALCTVQGLPFQKAWKARYRRSRELSSFRDRALLLGGSTFFGMLVFVTFMIISYFPKEYRIAETPLPWYLSTTALALAGLVLACSASLAIFSFVRRFDRLSDFWICIRFPLLVILSGLLLYTLWITYSRGALLALVFASIFTFTVYKIQAERLSALKRRLFKGRSVAALLSVLALLSLSPWITGIMISSPSWAQTEAGEAPQAMEVTSEGMTVSTSDLIDPTTFGFRLGYWRVAMRMALANWKCGVGLGNFHVGYPQYQFLGAGDVREAHNGFLQFFCESGLAGGLLFLSFWLFFFFWGAWRVIQQRDRMERRLLAGMYAGILAFLLHAFLDINFSHPSLMMVLFVFCGAFYSRASFITREPEEEDSDLLPEKATLAPRLLSLALMLAVLLAAGAEFRLFKQHVALNRLRLFNLSWEEEQKSRLQNAQFYFLEIPLYALARDRGEEIKRPPRLPLAMARMLIDDPEVLNMGYMFYRPNPLEPGKFHRIDEGDPIPDNALAIVRRPWNLVKAAVPFGLQRIEGLIEQDKRFPHSTELALHIVKWYELFARHVVFEEFMDLRSEWEARYLEWAEIVVNRNPHHADLHLFLGNACLWMGIWGYDEDDDIRRGYLQRAEISFEEMLQYCPISPHHLRAYSYAFQEMSQWYGEKGDEDLAESYMERSLAMLEKAQFLERERSLSHVYPW
ncbi:MAG: O-antigen ligase family protein [Candidatus Hydrogenedens sp.]|nr:O-antigen ligase family protein [Candidatus Hydrogenedens sp.]